MKIMNGAITRALVWKEWRESRWKLLAFFWAFHLPVLVGGLALLLNDRERFTLQTTTPEMLYKGFEPAIFMQSMFVLTFGLFLIIFYSAGTVSREIASRRIFFVLERPVTRWHALSVKYAVAGLQVYALAALTPLTSLLAVYLGFLAFSRTMPLDESLAKVVPLMGTALKIGLWRGVVGLMVYSVVFSFSVVFEHWWINMGAGVASVVAMFYFYGEELIMSIIRPAMGRHRRGEFSLSRFGEISTETFLVVLIVAAVCFVAAQVLFQRKEIA
jgi:ABC-type transport system involved in multi-copper enzyme maturation permease subunit